MFSNWVLCLLFLWLVVVCASHASHSPTPRVPPCPPTALPQEYPVSFLSSNGFSQRPLSCPLCACQHWWTIAYMPFINKIIVSRANTFGVAIFASHLYIYLTPCVVVFTWGRERVWAVWERAHWIGIIPLYLMIIDGLATEFRQK